MDFLISKQAFRNLALDISIYAHKLHLNYFDCLLEEIELTDRNVFPNT